MAQGSPEEDGLEATTVQPAPPGPLQPAPLGPPGERSATLLCLERQALVRVDAGTPDRCGREGAEDGGGTRSHGAPPPPLVRWSVGVPQSTRRLRRRSDASRTRACANPSPLLLPTCPALLPPPGTSWPTGGTCRPPPARPGCSRHRWSALRIWAAGACWERCWWPAAESSRPPTSAGCRTGERLAWALRRGPCGVQCAASGAHGCCMPLAASPHSFSPPHPYTHLQGVRDGLPHPARQRAAHGGECRRCCREGRCDCVCCERPRRGLACASPRPPCMPPTLPCPALASSPALLPPGRAPWRCWDSSSPLEPWSSSWPTRRARRGRRAAAGPCSCRCRCRCALLRSAVCVP